MSSGNDAAHDSADRIATIRGTRWIRYSRAQQILTKLEDLLTQPKSHRMGNVLIVGATNKGKTMIVRRFARDHPPKLNLGNRASFSLTAER